MSDTTMLHTPEDKVATTSAAKISTPDIPQVWCNTCEDYATYMSGDHDDNSRSKHNPVPVDAMTLTMLRDIPDSELIERINNVSETPNKSDIRVMYSLGYGFSWTEMQTIAKYKGFINEKPNSIYPHYRLADDEQNKKNPNIYSIENTNEEVTVLTIDNLPRSERVRASISLSRQVNEAWHSFVASKCNNNDYIRAISEAALIEFMNEKKNTRFRFISE